MREDVIFEHDVVSHRYRYDDRGRVGLHRRVEKPRLRRLQLSRIAPAALDVEQQVMALQQLGDIRFERDQVGRVLRVPADWNRSGNVPVNEAERPAEEVDSGRDYGRPNAIVV